ncbi:nicotinate (nicotinamide) nucleotide adenylyltransferase [Sulfurospirillum sp. 1612]|uniref:nicotinate (nicotinamide) nucleotide adenylyltransferase n=1 Tax=Sulfurospirillum sp. 1612 TaxID=3094835 RepID=UPI002F9493F6
MKIAIFGGSFDPPHIGHEMIVHEALRHLDIDTLFVIPTYLNPLKCDFVAPATKRITWLTQLFETQQKVKICDYEVKQQRRVYTIETIEYLLKTYEISKIYLIIGADNYKIFDQWRDHDKIQSHCELVVASRDDTIYPKDLKKLNINAKISSSKLRAHMDGAFIPKMIRNEVIEYYTRNIMEKRIERIVSILDTNKAESIQTFDMSNKDYIVDAVVIATTLGERHGAALLETLKTELKDKGEIFLNIDESSDWAILDMGDILVHLMSPAYREKYNIEEFLTNRELELNQEDH